MVRKWFKDKNVCHALWRKKIHYWWNLLSSIQGNLAQRYTLWILIVCLCALDGCRDDNIKFYHPPKTAHYIFILCLYVAAFPLCVTNFVIITHNYLFTSFIYSTWLLYFKYHVIIHTKITNSICNALFAKHSLKEFATCF